MPTNKYFNTWYKTRAESCSIDNCRAYLEFMKDQGPEKMHVLLKDNRKTFKKIFGKPIATWRGEFKFSVWIIGYRNPEHLPGRYQEEKFLIFTAKGKGTVIEICDVSHEKIKKRAGVIVAFVKHMIEKINKAEGRTNG